MTKLHKRPESTPVQPDWDYITGGMDVNIRLVCPCPQSPGARTERTSQLLQNVTLEHDWPPIPLRQVLNGPTTGVRDSLRLPTDIYTSITEPWGLDVTLSWARGDSPMPIAEYFAGGTQGLVSGPRPVAELAELAEYAVVVVKYFWQATLARFAGAYEWWLTYGLTCGQASAQYAEWWWAREGMTPTMVWRTVALTHLSALRRARDLGDTERAAQSSEVVATYLERNPQVSDLMRIGQEVREYASQWEVLRRRRRSWLTQLSWATTEGTGDWGAANATALLRRMKAPILWEEAEDVKNKSEISERGHHQHSHANDSSLGYIRGMEQLGAIESVSGPALMQMVSPFARWPISQLAWLLPVSDFMRITRRDPWAPDERLRLLSANPPGSPVDGKGDFGRILSWLHDADKLLPTIGERASQDAGEFDPKLTGLLLRGLADLF